MLFTRRSPNHQQVCYVYSTCILRSTVGVLCTTVGVLCSMVGVLFCKDVVFLPCVYKRVHAYTTSHSHTQDNITTCVCTVVHMYHFLLL